MSIIVNKRELICAEFSNKKLYQMGDWATLIFRFDQHFRYSMLKKQFTYPMNYSLNKVRKFLSKIGKTYFCPNRLKIYFKSSLSSYTQLAPIFFSIKNHLGNFSFHQKPSFSFAYNFVY